ncbi:Smr/MutS family protein [Pelagicoccus albus]|uniref:Smr/MutS family protein n=1 Tax=Pelagicoccus albus TaxID=415222 RepID=A0A7X1B7I9_9BACT|nr:Smr/MutS family protein [Pelagicoccus albus]MBC2607006.1 Smr/MutS family protein [Pelagicoccus albus]
MEDEPVEFPISDELDLHTFRPGEVKELLPDYFELCREKGIFKVRVIHGKGTGALRELVHAQLKKNDSVIRFELGDQTSGGWGATLVWLKQSEVTEP